MKPYPRYKDSGVEWIGEIPEHWHIVRFKFMLPITTNKSNDNNNSQRKIALEHIQSFTGKLIETDSIFEGEGILFNEGDILFGKLRPYLAKLWVADSSGSAVGDFFVFTPSEKVYSRYGYYRLLSKEYIHVINGSTFGAKMPRASWDFIGNLPFTLPKYSEQHKIANYLDHKTHQIDTLIAKKQRLIELLKEERTAVINEAVTKGIDPDAPMKDSGIEWLGEIPAHWEAVKLKYIADVGLGKMLTPNDKGGYQLKSYLRAKNLLWYNVDIEDIKTMWFSENELEQYRLIKNDLLVSEGGEVGRTCIWQEELPDCYIQNSVNRVRFFKDNLPYYFLYLFSFYGFKGHFEAVVSRVSIAHLTKEKLINITFIKPPLSEQKQIANYLDQETNRIDTLITKTTKEIDLLQEFRTALISEVVTGKIDVRDWEQPQNDRQTH